MGGRVVSQDMAGAPPSRLSILIVSGSVPGRDVEPRMPARCLQASGASDVRSLSHVPTWATYHTPAWKVPSTKDLRSVTTPASVRTPCSVEHLKSATLARHAAADVELMVCQSRVAVASLMRTSEKSQGFVWFFAQQVLHRRGARHL